MGQLVGLKKQEEEKQEPIPIVIESLRNLLRMAEEGSLRSFVGIGIQSNDNLHQILVGEVGCSIYALIGGVAVIKGELLRIAKDTE